MNEILRRYIIKNYHNLMTKLEREIYIKFMRYYNFEKLSEKLSEKEKNFIKENPKELFVTSPPDGYEINEFLELVAKRILNNEYIFINRCPICGTLARTPYAKQGPCGHQWQNKNPH